MLGGRAWWLKKYRSAVLPAIPRTMYRFSFVGVNRIGGTTYIIRYNECVLRPRLKRIGRGGRPMRGRRLTRKIYEMVLVKEVGGGAT